ncbi:TaqI-like C-terminal specificity domain-containing protein [Weeksellaceae bacterium A-14]
MTKFKNSESWVVLSPIEKQIKEKIERIGTPLKDWDIRINYGIKTGFNDAFIIDGAKRKELIDEDPKSEEIIRPILRGRDIKRYGYEFADLWLINTHNGVKEKGINRIKIEDYPAIKKHLDQYYPQLEKRADKGETPYNLRNCAYMEDFSRQKITYIEIMTDNPDVGYEFPCFSFDKKNCVALNTAYIMTGNVEELKHILGILNSKLGRLLVKNYVVQLQQRQFRMLNQYVVNFPIPKTEKTSNISKLVNEILSFKEQLKDTKILEQEIDSEIYKLFEFNSEEIKFINNI